MPDNKPRSRERHVTGSGTGAYRKGDGLGTGPVGSTGGHAGGPTGGNHQYGGGHGRAAKAGGGSVLLVIIIIVLYMLFSGDDSDDSYYDSTDDYGYTNTESYATDPDTSSLISGQGGGSSLISQLTEDSYGDSGIYTDNVYSTQPEMISSSGGGSVDTSVASGARAKYTKIRGGGQDTVTIMVYLCGTDLESRSGMASNDLAEMAKAKLSDKVNIVVYTGGCKSWKTKGISSKVNQIYQITPGGMKRLVDDDGNKAMTDPATLTGFIKYCSKNFPADRNELILWDHGGGSVSGYGYDEKVSYGGSMDLSLIDKALTDGGVTFDFIGYDACLMATAENAIMLDKHADYMIASEEIEPGIGWFYTNWLTRLSANTSMPTLDIGKKIIDDYMGACDAQGCGQKTTLSIVDLAEFNYLVPDKLGSFGQSVSDMIRNEGYKSVSDARYSSREFGQSTDIDQVDLIDLAQNINNSEGRALTDAVRSSVKYSRNSSSMSFAHGVAIFFPQNQKSLIKRANSSFDQIGVDTRYLQCISDTGAFATQASQSSGGGYDLFSSLFEAFLSDGRNMPGNRGIDDSYTDYENDISFDIADAADYISDNSFDPSGLFWSVDSDDDPYISLTSSDWDKIHDIDLNLFLDDGKGYIDLGLDNVFTFEGDDMYADTSGAWLGLNGQVMPYYHTDTYENGDEYTITGYAPCLLNGVRSKLIIVFDNANPYGYVAGAVTDYSHEDTIPTDTTAKSSVGLNIGDRIQFICDYYTYDFKYDDTYMFGEEITVSNDLKVSDVTVDDSDMVITYRLTDIYDTEYWTPKLRSGDY
ncbi:MAG: peptidase C11 [Lachnospiraceae bacterium]|nr:peptidase C11 [Lachnospiraceae bacterium]